MKLDFKKWFFVLLITASITLVVIWTFNYITDPFGVFGDKFMDWQGYNMTMNPRIAKIGYLDKNHKNYNSYVIGGSKCSSINPEILNEYYGGDASFYSMLMYGGDFYDYEKTLHYLVENYQVDNIIIHKSMHEISHYHEVKDEINNQMHAKVLGEEELPFYFKFLTLNIGYGLDKIEASFKREYDPRIDTDFIAETGVYDKSVRDGEDLGTEEEFIDKYPEFKMELGKMDSSGGEENLKALRRMKDYCDERGVDFKFIVAPTYHKEMDRYEAEGVENFLSEASKITGFWDFSGYNSLSEDARNFYDAMHYRNSLGELMLAKMFDDETIDVPEDFGRYRENGKIIKGLEPVKRMDQ